MASWILFLGTGGGRVVTSKQLRQTGGFVVNIDGFLIWVDPGPGALVHARKRRVPVEQVSMIFISHNHLDHVSDINPVVEAITLKPRVSLKLLCPRSTFEEKVLYEYLHPKVKEKVFLEERSEVTYGKLTFSWFPLQHTTLTYGLKVRRGEENLLVYISDTSYFPELSQHVSGTKVAVINVLFPYKVNIGMHLSLPELEDILRNSDPKPEVTIITHLGGRYMNLPLNEMEEKLSEELRAKVMFARDNWKFYMRSTSEIPQGKASKLF